MIKKRMLGVDDSAKEHKKLKYIFRFTHDYTECYNTTDYMHKYSSSDVFDIQIIDIDLGPNSAQLGHEIAEYVMTHSNKPMVPAILVSAYKEQLEQLKEIHKDYFAGYVWKEGEPSKGINFTTAIRAAVDMAEALGTDEADKLLLRAREEKHQFDGGNKCTRCGNEYDPLPPEEEGILKMAIPHSELEGFDDLNMLQTGFAEKETIESMLLSCKQYSEEARTSIVIRVVRKLIHAHKMRH